MYHRLVRLQRYIDNKNGTVYDKYRTLLEVSERSVGLSGRTLRRIPFLAHALFNKTLSLEIYSAMITSVEEHKTEEHILNKISDVDFVLVLLELPLFYVIDGCSQVNLF